MFPGGYFPFYDDFITLKSKINALKNMQQNPGIVEIPTVSAIFPLFRLKSKV